jgi:hypothetical protein
MKKVATDIANKLKAKGYPVTGQGGSGWIHVEMPYKTKLRIELGKIFPGISN